LLCDRPEISETGSSKAARLEGAFFFSGEALCFFFSGETLCERPELGKRE
jgi:hypothetical protein